MITLGIVVIGRNEGERLRLCLQSVLGRSRAVVYVDSGSTDGSVDLARSLGAHTVQLDRLVPFTAARARNAGFSHLVKLHPQVQWVQFVDGDCEVAPTWLELAERELITHADTAVVCGRLRERFPEASRYNRLCDMEWDTPVGETTACGGVALVRAASLREVRGYREELIAGEEPELCVRLREAGWKVRRIDAEMALHDAAMTRFGQWWKRAVRAGHAFAECSRLHPSGPMRLWVRETRSVWFWGLILPACTCVIAPFLPPVLLFALLAYALLWMRVYRGRRQKGSRSRDARLYTSSCVLAKWPQVIGQILYHGNRLLSRRGVLIEYKEGTLCRAANKG
jgi:GT2 family glycosyltransferase